MIKIRLIVLGDIKEKYLIEAINEYKKRLTKYCNLEIVELKENNPKSDSQKDKSLALELDAKSIIPHLKGYTICLDILGNEYDSPGLAKKIQDLTITNGSITFIIGASNGLSENVKKLCQEKISFSPLTFPHQLMRVIFLEQLYRIFTIINNTPYHK